MSEESKQRLIDGDKLLYRAYEIYEDDDLTMYDLIAETESGKFDTTSDQGEATRLRSALEKIKDHEMELFAETREFISAYHLLQEMAEQALSSHTEEVFEANQRMIVQAARSAGMLAEDTGIQKVRESRIKVKEYIEKCGYTYEVDDIIKSYLEYYKQGFYVSYTMKDCITNLTEELEVICAGITEER